MPASVREQVHVWSDRLAFWALVRRRPTIRRRAATLDWNRGKLPAPTIRITSRVALVRLVARLGMMVHNADPAWYTPDPRAGRGRRSLPRQTPTAFLWSIVTWHFAAGKRGLSN